jgi:hypothetical protein
VEIMSATRNNDKLLKRQCVHSLILNIVHPFTLIAAPACAPNGALKGVNSVIHVANYLPCVDKILI